MLSSLKLWLFDKALSLLMVCSVAMLYGIGTLWYDNARMITSAYGLG